MRTRIILVITLVAIGAGAVTVAAAAPFTRTGAATTFAFLAGMLVAETLLLVGVFERRAPIFGRIFWIGPTDRRVIAMTFDDGPNEPYTSQVLDILNRFAVRATFFVLGENVARFPDTVRRAVLEGHEIGNHGYNHGVLPMRSSAYVRDQIVRTGDLVEKATGARPVPFRAPHGWRNPWVGRTAKKAGCLPVAWTLGVWDTDRPGTEVIVRRTLKGLRNGCVLLLHDGRGTEQGADASQLVEALPTIIREVREMGFRFLTVSEMAREATKR